MIIKTEIKHLNEPIKELFCDECRRMGRPRRQTRLSALECGQKTDCICWNCPYCGQSNFIADDLSILDSDNIEDFN